MQVKMHYGCSWLDSRVFIREVRQLKFEHFLYECHRQTIHCIYCCQTIVKFLKRFDKEFFGRLNGWPTVIIQSSDSFVTRLFIKVIPAMLSKASRLAGVRLSTMRSSDMLHVFLSFLGCTLAPSYYLWC